MCKVVMRSDLNEIYSNISSIKLLNCYSPSMVELRTPAALYPHNFTPFLNTPENYSKHLLEHPHTTLHHTQCNDV